MANEEKEVSRPDRQNEKPLTVWLPTPMHRRLKVRTAEKGMTVKEYIRRTLAKELDEA